MRLGSSNPLNTSLFIPDFGFRKNPSKLAFLNPSIKDHASLDATAYVCIDGLIFDPLEDASWAQIGISSAAVVLGMAGGGFDSIGGRYCCFGGLDD